MIAAYVSAAVGRSPFLIVHTENPAAPLACSPSCRSLYSVHVGPGPCHRPSKERLITGKKRISFFAVVDPPAPPPSSTPPPCVCLSFLPSTAITISQPPPPPALQFFIFLFISLSSSTPRLYFLLRRVRFKKTPRHGFYIHKYQAAPSGVDIKSEEEAQRSKLDSLELFLLWIRRYLSRLLGAECVCACHDCVRVCSRGTEATAGHMKI